MIHVCYGLHDKDGRYSKFTGTSMLSMFENTSAPSNSIMVHILHDNTLTADNRDKFNYIAGKYNQTVQFYNVENLCAEQIQLLREKLSLQLYTRFSIGMFYRLMLKNLPLQNVSKIIYLDADTIVNLDIRELWDYPMENHMLAATPELDATRMHMITNKWILHSGKVKVENYFCSGVLCLDLDKVPTDFFIQGVNWLAENTQCECPDQDFLNNFYSTNYARLPEKFDAFAGVSKGLDQNKVYRKIYHYAGQTALTFNIGVDALDKLFFSYFVKTPWFNENTILHMYEGTRQIFVERQLFATQVSALVSGKKRIFFTPPENTAMVKQIFFVSDSEEIIAATATESVQNLIEIMNKKPGQLVAFAFIGNYQIFFQRMIQAGFVAGRDFVDAMLFMSDANRVPMNTYPLLKML
ncbi:MAG: hypothetical protein J5809_04085 [Selenomonadaceae bacterium]|nr:hypothetical protein [Selenomonadaceae bacterium]